MHHLLHNLALCAVALSAIVHGSPADTSLLEVDYLDARQTQASPLDCAQGVHMIVGPGKGAAGKNGLCQSLINKVKTGISGSNVRTIMYNPNGAVPVEARNSFKQYITTYVQSCPNTPIVLFGYSVGGIGMMDNLCGASENIGPNTPAISSSYKTSIIAAIAYGEETHRAGQVYDEGTCKKDAPLYPRQKPACANYADIIQSYCDSDDPACCSGGLYPEGHKQYPMHYDDAAYTYINMKYQAYRQTHPIPGAPGLPIPVPA